MNRLFINSICLILSLLSTSGAQAARVWVEAESMADKGGWVVDQQFMDQMGSPYLMAHGLGKPVADASTVVEIPADGTYTVSVRTFNWTAPFDSRQGPGQFKVAIDGKTLSTTLGHTGTAWQWQSAGTVRLKAGKHRLTLHDLTGFNGRCDAICLSSDADTLLPDSGEALAKLRRTMLGRDTVPAQEAAYDFVVIGGGIAGMCAAVTAARSGLKVALVGDRPVWGGNNSAEVRVHLGGYAEIGPNKGLGRMQREFGHSRAGNAKPAAYYEDEKKDSFLLAEPNLSLYPSCRAVSVQMVGNRIVSVGAEGIESGIEYRLTAPLFSDCTGDGTIGHLAGADWAMGRESRSEYGESLAPEVADSLTMGSSIQWYSRRGSRRSRFPKFDYGIHFTDSTCERVTMGEWKWETGMNRNQITQAEQVRDYGLMVIFANWSFLKNESQTAADYANLSLDWAGFIAGKRESRRLLGDYVLKQDDIDKNVSHEDASFTTTWSIDLHFPDPENSANFPGGEFKAATNHRFIHPYAVPYRCLYSRNVDNLFMAGRNISVSHVALGTVRVMRTTGMMGEVVGMAAALCHEHSTCPRGVYQRHLDQLKAMMLKGAGRDADLLPDNQNFNLPNKLLPVPAAFKTD